MLPRNTWAGQFKRLTLPNASPDELFPRREARKQAGVGPQYQPATDWAGRGDGRATRVELEPSSEVVWIKAMPTVETHPVAAGQRVPPTANETVGVRTA